MVYTTKQMMAVALARQVKNHKTYIVGTGLPFIGVTLAKNTHAPDAHLIFETAILEGKLKELPTSVSDLRLTYHASVLWPMYRYFGFQTLSAQRDTIDAGFLGGAQIDPYGNLNSTSIGDYHAPKTRLTGSGGANGISTYCDTIIVMRHEKRRFVEQVDYITSPGWIDGPGGRARLGLDPQKGPRAVITDMGILRFDQTNKRMYLAEYFPGIAAAEIAENVGFDLDVSRAVEAIPPTPETLRVLNDVDPTRLMT